MSLNHCYQFWSNTVNFYSELGFLGFISVFGVGYQSKLTRDVIPSYINIQLVIHPIEARNRISTTPNLCITKSGLEGPSKPKLGEERRGEEVFPHLNHHTPYFEVSWNWCWSPGQTRMCMHRLYKPLYRLIWSIINSFYNSYDIAVYPH